MNKINNPESPMKHEPNNETSLHYDLKNVIS